MLRNKRQRPVNQNRFAMIPQADIPRSNFNRSHPIKTTFDASYLIPIMTEEVLPGDTWRVGLQAIGRLTTPLVPFLDNIHLDYFFFFVPNRLLWTNWVKMMGEQDDPGDSIDYTVPEVTSPGGGFSEDSLFDYLGVPPGTAHNVNALHSRAYNLIYNTWFRHQDLQNSVTVDKDDGPDAEGDYQLLKRCKRHDYFTSALPYPQKGNTQVDLPLGDYAPVTGIMARTTTWTTGPAAGYESGGTNANYADYKIPDNATIDSQFYVERDPDDQNYPRIRADLSSATAASISSLREAFQLQRMLERDARGGTRYTELVRSHFKVAMPDLNWRPEYLGGGSTLMSVTPIPNTSDTASAKQGDLAAVGYSETRGVGFTKSFVEHGVILGLVNARADINYSQGLHRMWSRQTKHDFYWPALAHLSEQPIYNREIMLAGSGWGDAWGYQERWAEYRYAPGRITSAMRSDHSSSLDVWHLAEDFASRPSLNADFIVDNSPLDRAVAVPGEPHIRFDGYFNVTCTRAMPTYSVPGLIDHF